MGWDFTIFAECKKEQHEEALKPERPSPPAEAASSRSELPWMSELQSKEWLNANLPTLPFSPGNPMFMALAPYSQPDTIPSRQPIRIFNPDAYCELCNKEFCNKYFLKTHKANKHGIYSDPPASEPSATGAVNIPSYSVNLKLPSSVPSSDKSDTKSQHAIMNPFSDIFPSPFPPKFFPKLNKPNHPNIFDTEAADNSTSFSSNGLPNGEMEPKSNDETEESSSPRNVPTFETNFKTELDQEGTSFFTGSSKLSPSQQNRELDLSNRLRRIGVMNPKAFCEICCKEYCNKYFLRTHKMKRHGIFIPDEKDKEIKSEQVSPMTWQQNTQTSPLNLIMSEQNSSERKTTSPTEISCDTCGIKFQNAGLAQLHNISVHSKQNERSVEDVKKEVDGEKNSSADAISEDLQKLQTMILQLNDLDVSRTPNICTVCSKEFENRYYLHAHMMTEHGLLVEETSEMEKTGGETESGTNNNTVCDVCGKDVQNAEDMKKHMAEFHSNNQQQAAVESNKEDQNGFVTPEKAVSKTEPRTSMNLTPTSSYCEICNKELCNKYFMKTHMQRMHGIEIENGAQIGGVVCDICNKELCSKYFLRVHKHNTHGIVEYGASLLQPRRNDSDAASNSSNSNVQVDQQDVALKPADLTDMSHRYFTHFTEVCTICSRRFRSTKWLKAHLLSDHGQAGADKWSEVEQHLQQSMLQHSKSTPKTERASPTLKIPNSVQDNQQKLGIQNVLTSIFGTDDTSGKVYHCSYCPYSTPLLPLLFVHERSHSVQASDGENVPLKCPVCPQTFLQAELLQRHMFSQHPFIPLPPFFNGNNDTVGEVSNVGEPSESAEEDGNSSSKTGEEKAAKARKVKRKIEMPSELKATYAIPQSGGDDASGSGYVMQAFMVEEEIGSSTDRRFIPSVVFLPVVQKQAAPVTVTFTLTPA